jgi:hypothetical protein
MDTWIRRLAVFTILGILLLAGCGISRRIAVSSMVPIVENTVESLYRDQDVETVGRGIPGNLLLMRGLCASDPGNRDLWALTSQLYFYYAVGFVEDEDPDHASLLYERGFELGNEALGRRGWFDLDLDFDTFRSRLEKAKGDDLPLLFWTLANWTKWIQLRLNDPAVLVDLPYAEAALERVLTLDADYFLGMPHAMIGTLKASKPVLSGGDPESARADFERAFASSGRRLLMFQVFYAQSYCRAVLDEECFEESLQEVLDAPHDLAPEYRLLNEVARRKATALMEQMDDLF